jgi:hypothetical protein
VEAQHGASKTTCEITVMKDRSNRRLTPSHTINRTPHVRNQKAIIEARKEQGRLAFDLMTQE